ncbi:hypothetical protein [Halobellus sp. H-GB7]|uniref:hypothetical protein n=1 Tax=Halobellus sp. H-GB7 TaxID=3069756 RepID=UPI0027B54F36|nr:hypothetical protein [Halobellus sp. H-GB7]MDQ2054134.1 hypothetical protein [Halobellus sp. H-GB7]
MVADLSDFANQEIDEQNKTGPSLKLYTAGSGNGGWAYVVEGSESESKKGSYSEDTKRGFIPQLKAVAEGTDYLNNKYSNPKVTIYTPNESIVGLINGENDPDPDYRELYRSAKKNYDENWNRWDIRHLSGGDNPARDLV